MNTGLIGFQNRNAKIKNIEEWIFNFVGIQNWIPDWLAFKLLKLEIYENEYLVF